MQTDRCPQGAFAWHDLECLLHHGIVKAPCSCYVELLYTKYTYNVYVYINPEIDEIVPVIAREPLYALPMYGAALSCRASKPRPESLAVLAVYSINSCGIMVVLIEVVVEVVTHAEEAPFSYPGRPTIIASLWQILFGVGYNRKGYGYPSSRYYHI